MACRFDEVKNKKGFKSLRRRIDSIPKIELPNIADRPSGNLSIDVFAEVVTSSWQQDLDWRMANNIHKPIKDNDIYICIACGSRVLGKDIFAGKCPICIRKESQAKANTLMPCKKCRTKVFKNWLQGGLCMGCALEQAKDDYQDYLEEIDERRR